MRRSGQPIPIQGCVSLGDVHRTLLQPLIERLEIAALKVPGVVVWLAVSGLIIVLVMLAGFNIIEARHNVTDIRQIKKLHDVNDAFQVATVNLANADAAKAALLVQPSPELLDTWTHDVSEYSAALATIAREGDEADRSMASAIETNLTPVLATEQTILSQVVAEGRPDGLQYFRANVAAAERNLPQSPPLEQVAYASTNGFDNPLTLAWTGLLNEASKQETTDTMTALGGLQHEQERNLAIIALLNGAGLLLAGLLLLSAHRFGRRGAVAQAEIEMLRRAVLTDPLTGLGNRRAFEEMSETEFRRASKGEIALSLGMIDVDEFKAVNDTWGHDGGDRLLRSISAILRESSGPDARLFRIGGDEFAVIMPGIGPDEAMARAERIRRAGELALRGTTLSLGVCSWQAAANDAEMLREEADAALYEAKMRGRNVVVRYESSPEAAPLFPAAKLQAVRRLLAEGDVRAVFHPIWHLDSHTVLAYEALSRPNPSYGLSGPQQAFEIAERFGRVADLDRICVERILSSVCDLPPSALLFINLSPYSLAHHSFSAGALRAQVEMAGLSPQRVVFEITERSHVAPEVVADAADALHREGFRVALDDVGTGNTGFEMLRKVSCDFMKIDQGVMASALAGNTGRAAVMAILAFAAETGAFVVIEGIEDAQSLEFVQQIGGGPVASAGGLIQGVQGFLWGEPAQNFVTGLPEINECSLLAEEERAA